MKVCRKCKVNKDDSMFSKEVRTKSGLNSRCKDCRNLACKIKYHSVGHLTKKRRDAKWQAEYTSQYKKDNPEYARESDAKRRATLRKQAPKWANRFYIKEAYALSTLRSSLTGIKYEVDHIVPIKCKTASGLHTEHNLAVIPAILNNRKLNNFIEIRPY